MKGEGEGQCHQISREQTMAETNRQLHCDSSKASGLTVVKA